MFAKLAVPFPVPHGAVLPDYGDGGLFGLVGAFRDFLDGGRWTLPGREESSGAEEGDGATPPVLVFILIDGLGDEFLQRFGAGGSLLAHRRRRITSVFPSTTASAVTTVLTGLAPAGHGLTGWFIRDPRFGGVIAPLPMTRRAGGDIREAFAAARLFSYPSLFQRRRRPTELVLPRHIAHSPYSRRHGRGARLRPYAGLEEMVAAVVRSVASLAHGGGGFVHAYYPKFDTLAHDHGCTAEPTVEEFRRIDAAFGRLLDALDGTRAEVVVSADHGFLDSPQDRLVRLHQWQSEVSAMLDGPIFGERRVAFCVPRRGAEADFEAFARERLTGRAVLAHSRDLVRYGLFGPGPSHRRLQERIGTHALLMETGWTVADRLPGEQLHRMVGVHGGLSAEEMWVPLIHARC